MPLATRNFALIVTLLAVAVSHVQPSTVILCPLQVDSVELVGLIIRFLSRASFAEIKLAEHPVSYKFFLCPTVPLSQILGTEENTDHMFSFSPTVPPSGDIIHVAQV